ncbi:BRO family protein [Bifidobacterium longum]|uniref:BRO family protein n=1 Tax=Bifidobacterium longum TaxID=216816 RepID=UPI00041B1D5B|nr:BRO family protein [Bifidobacterium longum]
MNRDEITRKTSELSTIAHTTEDSKVEYWYARELMTYMGYDRWENFSKAITRAKQACDNSGVSVESHFRDTTRDVTLGSGATRSIADVKLTRYACYLIAQNGDPKKEEVALLQSYFAVQTRKTEIIEQRMGEISRLAGREALATAEKKLYPYTQITHNKTAQEHSTRPTTPQNAGKDVIQATKALYRLGNATIVRYALKADGGTDAIPKRGYDHDSGYEPMQHRRLHARSRRSGHVQHAFHIGAGSRSAALHCGRTSVALLSATTKQNNQ